MAEFAGAAMKLKVASTVVRASGARALAGNQRVFGRSALDFELLAS